MKQRPILPPIILLGAVDSPDITILKSLCVLRMLGIHVHGGASPNCCSVAPVGIQLQARNRSRHICILRFISIFLSVQHLPSTLKFVSNFTSLKSCHTTPPTPPTTRLPPTLNQNHHRQASRSHYNQDRSHNHNRNQIRYPSTQLLTPRPCPHSIQS